MVSHKKLTNKDKIDILFKPDSEGKSEWLTRDEINNSNLLKLTDNGNFRGGKFKGVQQYNFEKWPQYGKVQKIRLVGFDLTFNNTSRPISNRVRKAILHKDACCVVCGSHSNLIPDHKNDLYNDTRVLNEVTQHIDDFQCLCQHCNLQKRQVCKDMKKYKKRYPATNIPALKCFGIDYISGNENYDENDPNTLIGTYWYDPKTFMEHIHSTFSNVH
jgi:hypothetical protein